MKRRAVAALLAGGLLAGGLLAGGCEQEPVEPELPRRIHLGSTRSALRPTVDGLWHFDAGEVVEQLDTAAGNFRLHYTRAGRNAVPLADADGSGAPDFVEELGGIYEEVLAFYVELGFRAPLSDETLGGDNGGDGRFDVYLLDFAGSSDGTFQAESCLLASPERCSGFMIQENDFAGYRYPNLTVANRILASHELFHAVQAAYDDGQGVIPSEGSAVWATEAFDGSLRDFEGFVPYYLADPGRSLDVPPPGPVPGFAYGSGLFFRFLEERFDRSLVVTLWEHCENGQGLAGAGVDPADPEWMQQLDLLLARDHGASFADAFAQFARWNLYTGRAADPSVAYANGAAYPAVVMESVAAPFQDPRLRAFHAAALYYSVAPAGRQEMTAALVATPGFEVELEGLVLLLGTKRGGVWEQLDEVPLDGAVVPTATADAFVVAVVNPALTGQSRKPALCLGSPEEVEACRTGLLGGGGGAGGTGGSGGAGGAGGTGGGGAGGLAAGGSGGAGAGGSGGAAGAGPGGSGGSGSAGSAGAGSDGSGGDADAGCGCGPSDAGGGGSFPGLLLLGAALGALRIRRPRRDSGAHQEAGHQRPIDPRSCTCR